MCNGGEDGSEEAEATEIFEELTVQEQFKTSSLYVSLDWLDLVEKVGEAEAWVVIGKLKDLLG
jgi:hypothetical protein